MKSRIYHLQKQLGLSQLDRMTKLLDCAELVESARVVQARRKASEDACSRHVDKDLDGPSTEGSLILQFSFHNGSSGGSINHNAASHSSRCVDVPPV
jgi:hypothetical protein